VALFIVFITLLLYIFGKITGSGLPLLLIGFVFATFTSLASYFYSDRLVLATVGAKPISKKDNPELFRLVENLCIGSGLPMPKIYIVNDSAPNAFATGRDPKQGAVCVTRGLLEKLDRSELEGVIAHELSHIRNFDTRLMAIVAILVGFVAILADIFMRTIWFGGVHNGNDDKQSKDSAVFLIVGVILAALSPLIATLIQLAVSRRREFLADASAALLTRYPEGLARALEKIASDRHVLKTASNATAHLFIVNPFKGKNLTVLFSSLFDTHPPIEERIRILRSM